MLSTYQYPKYDYVQAPEQKSGVTKRHPVVVVGAGPVALRQPLTWPSLECR